MSNSVKQDLLADLSQRERDLKEQLKEIKALRAALKGVGEGDDSNVSASQTSAKPNTPTFKEMIVSVLSEHGRGAQATEILGLIKTKFGKEIKRSSISPQLSRLKSEGVIDLDDKVWYLPEHRVVQEVLGEAQPDLMPGMETQTPFIRPKPETRLPAGGLPPVPKPRNENPHARHKHDIEQREHDMRAQHLTDNH